MYFAVWGSPRGQDGRSQSPGGGLGLEKRDTSLCSQTEETRRKKDSKYGAGSGQRFTLKTP